MPETIEAEVIAIDGKPPRPAAVPPSGAGRGGWSGERVRGTLLKFDRRWWPLWVVLAILLVAVAAVVGLVFGLAYLAYAVLRRILGPLQAALGPAPRARNGQLRPR